MSSSSVKVRVSASAGWHVVEVCGLPAYGELEADDEWREADRFRRADDAQSFARWINGGELEGGER